MKIRNAVMILKNTSAILGLFVMTSIGACSKKSGLGSNNQGTELTIDVANMDISVVATTTGDEPNTVNFAYTQNGKDHTIQMRSSDGSDATGAFSTTKNLITNSTIVTVNNNYKTYNTYSPLENSPNVVINVGSNMNQTGG